MFRRGIRTVATVGHNKYAVSNATGVLVAKSSMRMTTAMRMAVTPSTISVRHFNSSWFASPKGFGKFYDKKTGAGADAESKTGKEGGNRGGKGGKKPDGDDPFTTNATRLMYLIAILALLSMEDYKTGREISWQDFKRQLLEAGVVDKIIVTNKSTARVILRPPVADKSAEFSTQFADPAATDRKAFGADGGFGWDKPADTDSNAINGESAQAPYKFSRYPTLGSNNQQANSPFYFNIGTVETFERKLEDAQRELGIAPRDFIPVVYINQTSWSQEFMRFLPTLLLIGAMAWLMRGAASSVGGGGPGNIFKIGKSTAKRVNKEQIKTTFKDVAGCDEAKREIMEFVQFLKDPKRFTDLGAKIPKGALLCGPPGTGKTLLAKATAGEANVPFFSISGSDFVEMFVGVGPSRVRDLFKEARENAPCILFIDEIDAVGRQRGRGGFSGGNDERENTLNQLLVEMDGFDTTANIVILAGTNRIDVLDQALTRPGRFDRQITVDRPDIKGRKAIFEIYLKTLTLDGDVENFSGRLAALTPGFVGADIANICNEAAIIAARREKKKIDIYDFETATERIIGGLESRKIMTAEEKRVVAYHEAGHAVAGWNLEHADPLLKVTIVPRSSGALGFAQYLPKELFLRTKDQILDMVCMALAGRASEQVNFGRVTTGAADDLRRVTQIVYQMVQVYGMNDKVGQLAFPKEESQFPQDRMYSNALAEVMDEEVRAIVEEAYERTLNLIKEKQDQVKLVAELLIEKETITNIDVIELIGKRPHANSQEYDEFVSMGWSATKALPAAEVESETKTDDKDAPSLSPI